jgi:hypothetical protein
MASDALDNPLDEALGRIEKALTRLEAVAASAAGSGQSSGDSAGELAALRTRHRKLKDTVTQEIQQLDLLLANLPQ